MNNGDNDDEEIVNRWSNLCYEFFKKKTEERK